MGAFAGAKTTTDGILFTYDMDSDKSHVGAPTTNYAYLYNPRIDDSYAAYDYTADTTWLANHSDAIRVYNDAGTQISGYVNTGVDSGVWQPTQHAIWTYDEELRRPVVTMRDWDGKWKAKSFSTGQSMTSMGIASTDQYTISWLQWTDDIAKSTNVGLYGQNQSATNGFHDGLSNSVAPTTSFNTKSHTWQRVYATYTAVSTWNFSATLSCYMYGHYIKRGTLKVADVQIESTPYPTGFSKAQTRSNTEALLDVIGGNTITENSLTYAAGNTFSFNGTSDYLTTSTIPEFTSPDVFSISTLIKPTSLAAASFYLTPAGLGVDRFLRLNTNGSFSIQLTEIADSGGRSFTSATGAVVVDQYVYLTYVVNGTSIKLYKNGVLESSQTDVSGVPCGQWGGYVWTIGQRSNSTFWFTGEIPIVQAYDKALTADEVHQNFSAIRGRFGI
jgi:hypothetical protein